MVRIGIIKEGKVPQDTRVPLTPSQASLLLSKYPDLKIKIENSSIRCYKDEEYVAQNINVTANFQDCELLIGVKEVPLEMLIPGKTYMFFSHTIKEQPYNRKLLQEVLRKNIRLMDYEVLTDNNGIRLIGFGRYAGIVGAHYALLMWGKKNNLFKLKKAVDCKDYLEMKSQYKDIKYGSFKAVITGGGRVALGSVEVMEAAGITKVSPEDFLNKDFDEAIYTQFDVDYMYEHKDKRQFEFNHFFKHPEKYNNIFNPYLEKANVLINAIYWDPNAPRLFEKEDIKENWFNVQIISDISCDIKGSVPITTRATTISDPVYGYDPQTMDECKPYRKDSIDLMTVDNLPNELPRDASEMFGEVMSEKIIPLYIEDTDDEILQRATIARDGELTSYFQYLKDYVEGQ